MEPLEQKVIDQKRYPYYVFNSHIQFYHTELHSHSKMQLLYAEGGIVHIFTKEQHWYLPSRCCMLIPANMEHRLLSNSGHVEIYDIYMELDKTDGEFYREPIIFLATEMLREMILFTKGWSGVVDKVQHPSRMNFLKGLKSILPEAAIAVANFPIQHPYPNDARLISIAQYLRQHIAETNSFEDISKRFGFSPRSLSRLFKEKMGMNYVRLLRALRLSSAVELMAEKRYNLNEIAQRVGYNSISSFSNVFERTMGIRPTEFMSNGKKKPLFLFKLVSYKRKPGLGELHHC
jgi:AraC-like DNA-binding protein